ncbi:MAG: ABC transporter ATP-binding protein [Phycisphaerales bacterium]
MTVESAAVQDTADRTGRLGSGASVVLEGVTKAYGGDVVAVDDIYLTIAPGEFITLLGPSGSGKTTTLNMIAGFATPTSGRVSIDGQIVNDIPPHKRAIGMVFQQYALFPHMTVAQNVEYPLKQRKIAKDERARMVQDSLAMVRLENYADRLPRALSGGQQQRVAVARASVFSPSLLLMDEPLGALDKKLREALQLEFRRIHRVLGATIVFVTHDQEEALVMSDRIAVFNEGRIEQLGSAVDLYESPATPFVANFLGESNMIHGEIRVNAADVSLAGPVGDLRCRTSQVRAGAGVAMVRPERMEIETDDVRRLPATDDVNRITGTVSEIIYLGSQQRVLVDVGQEKRFVGIAAPDRPLAVGQSVTMAFPAEDTIGLANA